MLLSEVIYDSSWGVTKRKSTCATDDHRLWLVHEELMTCERFSDVFGTMVYVRHCFVDGPA